MKLLFKTLLALTGLIASVAWGQADYPNKPIRMIVPFPPGGVTDIVARTVSVKLSAELGQPIVVENRAGASGAIGAELGARAAPDGYTLIMGNISTLGINPITFVKLGYDPVTSFDPISLVAVQPLLITVHPGVAAKNLTELVQLAKSQPGQLNYGTAGSSIHLAVEQFNSLAGIRMNHIAYKGSAPAITDLVGGQIQVLFDPFSSIYPLVAAGKIRALAVTTEKRAAAAPQLQTVAEQGYAGFDVSSWQGIVVPAGTPKPVIQRLHRGLVTVMASSEVKDKFAQYSAVATASTPEQFAAYIKEELIRWQKVAQQAGVKPE
ncbi:tripartite tricarboxylate transporter substrate binding protein [Limnohabitans sp. Rim8]|uniref:Bug family tripartite tricarboxylate transporter substrate binding protein n=1 Tax=Limnohabitans sp. Rim8 TaxID=1100718 RepID=UPI00261468D4|nr:tripartite tricarboxylate transporter substrate binding protein [Limnohabitans sp. Rim8]